MKYSFQDSEAKIYDIVNMDEMVQKVALDKLVKMYKTTRLYYSVQYEIRKLIIHGLIIDDSSSFDENTGYPYDNVENFLNKMTEHFNHILGPEVLEGFDDEISHRLENDTFKRDALIVLLNETSDSDEDDVDLFLELIEMVNDPDFDDYMNDELN